MEVRDTGTQSAGSMYSMDWFRTFAETIPASRIAAEVDAICGLLPLEAHRRILDIGCGDGRIAAPLQERGYRVTGLDANVDVLRAARRRAPEVRHVALDQRHVGRMRWGFDGALVLWNSLGFADRAADLETLRGVRAVLRPGGRLLLDLYHPDWLRAEGSGDSRRRDGVSIRRRVRGSRCLSVIRYPSGVTDAIEFEVYLPDEIRGLAREAGLEAGAGMVWWDPSVAPGPESPRYQLVCAKPAVAPTESPRPRSARG